MKYIGHPLIGDFLYGVRTEIIDRQALHSWKIKFIHPILKEEMVFQLELPTDMKKIIDLS